MTVSRVLNRSGYVGESTRERVEQAVESLGYIPNQNARGLRSVRSGIMALLVTDVTNPFFTTVARGVEDVASSSDHLVLLGNTDEVEEEELRYMRMLVQKGVDGVLFVPARGGEAALALAHHHKIPVVVIDRRSSVPNIDSVRCDSFQGAFDLGKLLVEHGHRRFGILAGPAGVTTMEDRINGFLSAVGDSRSVRVLRGNLTVAEGERLMQELVDSPARPTGVLAANNFLAIGGLNYLRQAGIQVPTEMSVVGFDDLPEHLITFPFLTVASQPAYEMGAMAAQLLLRKLVDPDHSPENIVLATVLNPRSSHGFAPFG